MNPQDDPEYLRDLESSTTQPWIDATPQRPGLRVGWIILGLLVLGLVIGGGVMIAERMSAHSKPVAGRPTIIGGGGAFTPSLTTPASRPPNTPPPPATGNGEISVAGIEQDETHACADSVVSVSGVHNRVVLTGHCTRVDVSGVRNTVIIEEADAIVVSGLDNTVTFASGSPEVSQSGFDNKVARA